MDFLIADAFPDSLARLTGDEQKAVKTTAFDLRLEPANPGMSFHRLDQAKDKGFWSVRVGSDLRLIVHRSEAVRCSVRLILSGGRLDLSSAIPCFDGDSLCLPAGGRRGV